RTGGWPRDVSARLHAGLPRAPCQPTAQRSVPADRSGLHVVVVDHSAELELVPAPPVAQATSPRRLALEGSAVAGPPVRTGDRRAVPRDPDPQRVDLPSVELLGQPGQN